MKHLTPFRRIRETKAGAEVRQWVWNGTSVQEERLVNGTKLRFWTGGFEILDASNQQTGKRLLVTDHLGSTRVVVDGTSGASTASYDYAPWGKRTKISGTEEWSTGYTGHGWHESGLSLAVFRPYDPDTGRWPSRDPIQERGGLNLYRMAGNDSVNRRDYLGLLSKECKCRIVTDEMAANNRTIVSVKQLNKRAQTSGEATPTPTFEQIGVMGGTIKANPNREKTDDCCSDAGEMASYRTSLRSGFEGVLSNPRGWDSGTGEGIQNAVGNNGPSGMMLPGQVEGWANAMLERLNDYDRYLTSEAYGWWGWFGGVCH